MWFVVQDFTNEYISVLLLIISFIKHFCNYESNIFSLLKMWKIIKNLNYVHFCHLNMITVSLLV